MLVIKFLAVSCQMKNVEQCAPRADCVIIIIPYKYVLLRQEQIEISFISYNYEL